MLCVDKTGLALLSLLAVLLHELGHLFAMSICGLAPKAIRLIPASIQIVKGFCASTGDEMFIAAAGPFANFLIFGLSYAAFYGFKIEMLAVFAALNFIYALFNLLPVKGLDGGTIIMLLISKKRGIFSAERILQIITALISVFSFGAGAFLCLNGNFNPSLFALAIYFAVCIFLKI